MASLLAVTGGAIINALAFSGTNYAFHSLSRSDAERKRHDLEIERYQRDHTAWVERRQARIDAEAERRRRAQTSENHLRETDRSMVEYAEAHNDPEPQLFMYRQKSPKEKKNDLILVLGSIAGIGVIAYYLL